LSGVMTAALCGWLACGGGTPTTNNNNLPPSGLTNRAFITVDSVVFGGANGHVALVDVTKDNASPSAIAAGVVPTRMVVSADKSKTLVLDPNTHGVFTIDNKTESELAALTLGEKPTSAVVLGDNKTGYVAVRNFGQVIVMDITMGTITTTISALPEVRTLVLSHNGKKILAFSDDSDSLNVIDTTANTATSVSSASFSRPVFGIFNSDDSKAYILSCGPECGGAGGANVSLLDMTALTAGPPTAVSAATIGLLDNSGNLFVAGTAAAGGRLDVVNASSLVVSKSGVAISAGFHDRMALANGLLFIGAHAGQDDSSACNNGASGCLSMFNVGSSAVTIETPKGGVTGIQPINGRNVVYVCEGGELVIYDTTTAAPQARQLDIIGTAMDVKAVDQ
jgi:hypothetical protein